MASSPPLTFTFNSDDWYSSRPKPHYHAATGEEKVDLWDLLGIRSANGQSLSRNPSSSPIPDRPSLPSPLSSYLSASPFQRKGSLWIPGETEAARFIYTTTVPGYAAGGPTWSKMYTSFLGGAMGIFDPPTPVPPPVQAERETPAIGFRAWTIEIKRKKGKEYASLRGVSHKEPWPGRETMTFRCDQKHQTPEATCGCGLYAYHQPNGAPEYMGQAWLTDPYQVMGAVVAWGKIIEYKNGFRAQYARPIALGVPPNPENATQAFLNQALAEKAASLLQLPFVPYKNLVTYAREFGERLSA